MTRTATLYQNIKTREVTVRRMTRHPIGAEVEMQSSGPLTESNMGLAIADEVIAALDAYGTMPFDAAKAREAAIPDRDLKNYAVIGVKQESDVELIIVPYMRTKGGSIGRAEQQVVCRSGDRAELGACLLRALEIARSPEFLHTLSGKRYRK